MEALGSMQELQAQVPGGWSDVKETPAQTQIIVS